MRRKCYISYKFDDKKYRDEIVERFGSKDFIDNSQQEEINSTDPDYIMRVIREKWLRDSTVTIFLIGKYSADNYIAPKDYWTGYDSQIIIRREISASLYNGNGNSRNGLLGVVLPCMTDRIFEGERKCSCCDKNISIINLCEENVIKEFSKNYFIQSHKNNCGCEHYNSSGEYAVLVRYSDFMKDLDKYIEKAFEKRSMPIASKVHVR